MPNLLNKPDLEDTEWMRQRTQGLFMLFIAIRGWASQILNDSDERCDFFNRACIWDWNTLNQFLQQVLIENRRQN
jgi:hypothetical protein